MRDRCVVVEDVRKPCRFGGRREIVGVVEISRQGRGSIEVF